MSWPIVAASARRLLESPARRVDLVFAGGEPLLALDLIERAVTYIERRRPPGKAVQYNLATNGTLLDPRAIAFLDAHRFEIQLSFDGIPAAQAVRGARSFARIDAALDRLLEHAPALFWKRLTVGVTLDADACRISPSRSPTSSTSTCRPSPSCRAAARAPDGRRACSTRSSGADEGLQARPRHYDDTGDVRCWRSGRHE